MPASRESPLRHAARTVCRRMPAEALAAGVGRSKPDVRRAWDSLCEKEGCAIAALFPEDPAKLESAAGNIAVLPPEFSQNNYLLRGGGVGLPKSRADGARSFASSGPGSGSAPGSAAPCLRSPAEAAP